MKRSDFARLFRCIRYYNNIGGNAGWYYRGKYLERIFQLIPAIRSKRTKEQVYQMAVRQDCYDLSNMFPELEPYRSGIM